MNRMSVEAFEKAVGIIDQNCFFVNIDEVDVSIDGIIEKAEQLVIRKGIQGVIIDPWNYVEQRKDRSQTETEYISETLTKLKRFLKRYDVHCFLIAHPTKLRKEGGKYEVPTMYSISGSAHFFNKTDNGITVYRDFETNNVDVHIQKVKNYWLGKLGCVTFMYHEAAYPIEGKVAHHKQELKEVERVDSICDNYLLSKTSFTQKQFNDIKKTQGEWYFDIETAQEHGLVNEIL